MFAISTILSMLDDADTMYLIHQNREIGLFGDVCDPFIPCGTTTFLMLDAFNLRHYR